LSVSATRVVKWDFIFIRSLDEAQIEKWLKNIN
jgi:hypothetical protein